MLPFVFVIFGSCRDNEPSNTNALNNEISPITSKNKVIYEVNLYNYSSEGNFKGLEKDLPRLKELGVDIVWLMPIHPRGEKNRSGTLGSPYSVRDYKAINSDFGSAEDFKSLVKSAHAKKIEIWLDWVANHTAWDNVWITDHLDFYAEKNGQRPYSPDGWPDVIQLDYNNIEMCDSMISAMKFWVSTFDIDGFRCDAADRIPVNFWSKAKNEINKVKQITWLSEGYDPLHMSVFDYDYAWDFSTALQNFGQNNDVEALKIAAKKLFNNETYENKSRMVYLTNHDLDAYNGSVFDRYGKNVLPLTVLYFTIYDMPLILDGQEIGMKTSLSFSELTPINWNNMNKVYLNLFETLTRLKRTQYPLEDGTNRGALKIYETDKNKIFAYSRLRGDKEVLVLLNLGNVPVRFYFTKDIPSGKFRNYLNGAYEKFSEKEGIDLHENGYEIFVK